MSEGSSGQSNQALMRSRLAAASCLVLTGIVLHTCLRIEVLNARSGYPLPRVHHAVGNPKWRVAAAQPLRAALDRTIAIERLDRFVAANPEKPQPSIEEFIGPPYSEAERALIDQELARNSLNAQLHSWVSGMGLLQYVLAPLALIGSLALLRRRPPQAIRMMLALCVLSNVIAIYFLIARGYFASLGW